MAKTQYQQGVTSDNRDRAGRSHNSAVIEGRPYPASNRRKMPTWKETVASRTREAIKNGLKEIDSECNLYVSFFIHSHNREKIPDVDNLLKAFLDPLQKKYGSKKKPQKGGGLVKDDRVFRGIRAEREIISADEKERVEFKYLTVKTFQIIKVWKVAAETEDESLKDYRSYWSDPMQVIQAREVGVNYAKGKYDYFIDNAYGAVHVTEKTRGKFPDVIPGYDWKTREGSEVEGCMVFKRKHNKLKADQGQGKSSSFYWLKKWHSPF